MRDHREFYKPGSWNALCDVCGFKFKSYELKRRWDGMMVCSDDYETRHPQDLLRARREITSVAFTRPDDQGLRIVVNPLDPDDVSYYKSNRLEMLDDLELVDDLEMLDGFEMLENIQMLPTLEMV